MKIKFAISLLFFVCLLMESVSAADYLLVAKENAGRCDVSLWSPIDQELRIVSKLDACPDRLFVSESHASAFYLESPEIIQLSLQGSAEPRSVAELPDLIFENFVEDAFSRPLSDYEEMTASSVMEVRNTGFTGDGALWVHVGLVLAGDDDYDFLLKLVNKKWRVEEFVHCHRFEDCEFLALANELPNSRHKDIAAEVWSDSVSNNPFFVGDETTPNDVTGYRSLARTDRHFSVNGENVILRIWTGTGPDTGYIYLAGAEVRYDNGDSVVICEAQCRARLMGQFLLAQRFWGGTLELYDIATGDSVLGPLKHAIWLRRSTNEAVN